MRAGLLGALTPRAFLRRHWQKEPLLVRNALPGFEGLLTPDELIRLACHVDARARLVIRRGNTWRVKHGPFARRTFAHLPQGQWTLLVQDVNHFLPDAWKLLLEFDFIPRARLDDLMVSYAPDGGGVGPHVDSYDVFLLQGAGRRRWQISAQQDTHLIEGAPLKILRHFEAEQEWMLEPGDMLYLPPGYAHDGVAQGDGCMTCSIGFRAPTHQELATQFLFHLQERLALGGMYRDPDLAPTARPGHIGTPAIERAAAVLDRIRWNRADVEHFMGCHLTEPKPHVFFTPPADPLGEKAFARETRRNGLKLNLRSCLLYRKKTFFLNGESYTADIRARRWLKRFADARALPPGKRIDRDALALCHQWYLHGFIEIPGQPSEDDA